MPKLKFATKYNETTHQDEKFYPISITPGIIDTARGQRLSVTLANKAEMCDIKSLQTRLGDSANSYTFVDLGLPSGTLWATCNVGASSETDYGDYYGYGKITTYQSSDYRYSGMENPLSVNNDIGHGTRGGYWYMPTEAQLEELLANTTFTWETNFKSSGKNGAKFTAPSGNYIFFPAAGRYDNSLKNAGTYVYLWSCTPAGNAGAKRLHLGDDYTSVGTDDRIYGHSIRPVISTSIMEQLDNVDTNKANKPSSSTNNNLAALDASGNLKDSGYSAADLLRRYDLTVNNHKLIFTGEPATVDGHKLILI